MFNIGFTEMLFIGVLALLLIGPKQLPEVARTVGKFLNEIKRATEDVSQTLWNAKNSSQDYLNQVVHEIEKPETPPVNPPVAALESPPAEKTDEPKS